MFGDKLIYYKLLTFTILLFSSIMLRKAEKGTKQNPKRQAILRTANPLPVLKITAAVFRIKKNGSQFEISVKLCLKR
ncbi:MAG TPA: hypothetical protein DEW35_05520 [Ruminococcaceae bacterium]|nr:hypothetical protein [Oscillospiraceae bacterium]